MAHFFGGRVAPAEGGWAVGVHTSEIVQHQTGCANTGDRFSLLSSHKDQVAELLTVLKCSLLMLSVR